MTRLPRRLRSPLLRAAGFTLIELLVVVSIIVLMIALLMPALASSRETTRRAMCAGYQRQFAIVHTSYAIDNRGELLASNSVMPFTGPEFRYPFQLWTIRVFHYGLEEFSLPAIAPWMPGGNQNALTMGLAWKCPSVDPKVHDAWTQYYWNQPSLTVAPLSYSYFGRADIWGPLSPGASAAARAEMTGKELRADKVLLADYVFYWGYGVSMGVGGWGYNHGRSGPRLNNALVAGGNPDPGPPGIAGVNRAYGDGHVQWAGEEQFDPARLQATDPGMRWIYGASGDKTTY